KKHGEFSQVSSNHLSGQGCPKCGAFLISRSQKKTPTGWSIKQWENKASQSKNFDSFKVYIIKCWNDDETFYKIGRTFMSVKKRFCSKKTMPYNYEILQEL